MVADLAVFEYHRTPRQDGQIVIVADFSDGDATGVSAVKRYRADASDHWHFASDNPSRPGGTLNRTEAQYPILGTFVAMCERQEV